MVLLDYDKQRSHYRRYVCGEVSSPILTVQGTDNLLNILNIDTKSKVIMSINWVGRYYERCAKEKLPISPDEQYTYSSTAIAWQCTVTDQGYIGQGSGPRKPEAKNAAYGVLYESRFGSTTISNAGFSTGSIHKHSVRYSYDYDHNLSTAFITIFSDKNALVKIKCNVTQQEVSSIITRVISERELYVEAFHDYMTRKYNLFEPNSPLPPDECPEVVSTFEDEARPSTTSNSKLIRIPMEKLTDEQKLAIDPEYFTNKKQQEELAAARNKLTNRAAFGDISTHIRQRSLVKISETASLINSCERPSSHSNSSGDNPNLAVTGSEDAVSQGSSNRGGIAPQATSTIATPQPPEQIIESTGGLAKTTVLNPYGPVNRMTEGAITFDYPSLVYSQFMDTDQTYRITDSMAANQIILQIPYDPLSQYMNDYIRTYVGLHSRYNGDIIIRVNTISNQTFSGAMIVSWFPTQYPAEVASRPNIQKYSYQIMALVMPSTEYYILKDARQYLYYRETSDTDIPTRPHLVFAVHLPLRSPLKDGVFADIVIGSRLCNQFDAKFGAIPFYVANPILVPIGPTPGGDTLNGKALSEVFPTYDINFLNMCIDGITTLPQYSLLDQQGMEIFFDLRSPVPCLTGGVFPDANNRRLVATDFEQGVIQNDQIRVCVVISRLSLNESKTVANTQTFIDTCKGDNWLEQCKTAAWLRTVVSVYCSRNNSATLNVYTKDSFKIDLVQQTTMVTSIGLIYILCYNSNVPSNNLTYAAMGGIPDQAQPTAIVIPHNPVLGAVDTSDRLVPLPQLWAALKFTTLNPGIVTSNAEIAPTLVTEASILKKFDDLSAGLPSDQCIQFELLEPVAQTRVAIVRYLHVQRDFVISPADGINYKRYPNSASHLVISQYGTVRTNSGFPQTETPGWPKRFPDSNLMTESYYRRVPTISNAAIAAAEVLPESIIGMDSAIADLGEAIQNRRIQQTMFREPQTRGAMTTNTANARSSNPIFRPQTGGSDKYLDYLIYGVLPYASTQSNGNMATGIAGAIERPVEFSQNMNFQRSQNELDREQALLMQSNSQDFQKNLQQATFQQQKDLEMQREQFETGQQERGFKFQTDLNNQRFGQEKELQNNTFSQQTNILTQQENFAKQMNSTEFGEHMIEAATGGVLSLANTTIGKVGDYVLENQRYNDQKRLMTQNANLQIQTSGMTSQAMRIGDQY